MMSRSTFCSVIRFWFFYQRTCFILHFRRIPEGFLRVFCQNYSFISFLTSSEILTGWKEENNYLHKTANLILVFLRGAALKNVNILRTNMLFVLIGRYNDRLVTKGVWVHLPGFF